MGENTTVISSQASETGNQNSVESTATGRTYTEADVEAIRQQMTVFQGEAIERAREEGRNEAEKLAKMNQEQRSQYERERQERDMQERERKLAEREQEIARRELRAEAVGTLASKGLSADLAQILDYSSAEACDASIKTVERVIRSVVQTEIEARLRNNGADTRRDSGGTTEEKTAGEQLAEQIGRQRGEARRQADDIINKYYLRRS